MGHGTQETSGTSMQSSVKEPAIVNNKSYCLAFFFFNVSLFMSLTTLQDKLRKLVNICLSSLS